MSAKPAEASVHLTGLIGCLVFFAFFWACLHGAHAISGAAHTLLLSLGVISAFGGALWAFGWVVVAREDMRP
ncbi:MAG: hypothetical protein KGL39_38680 [Patescibacteria group bacterium]|nr:hypothetical protein [Patescibacteria group bacterium]